MMDQWLDILVRRVAQEVSYSRVFKGTLCCTSYDPKTHTVKGVIVPHGIETGFIPLQALHTSGQSGTGMFVGPSPGDAASLQDGGKFDGDQLDVEFDIGDPNTIVARHRMSQPQNPPEVQAGEHLVLHEKGSTTLYAQDGSITTTHYAAQGFHKWHADGSLETDTKGKSHTIKTSGGNMTINTGGGTLNIN